MSIGRRVLVSGVTAAVVLSSCGGSDSDDDPIVTSPPTTEAEAEPTEDFTPVDGTGDVPLDTAATSEATETTPSGTADGTVATDVEPTDTGTDGEGAAAEGVVDVSMIEWEIDAPIEYSAGDVTFSATNDGNFPHEFVVIQGDGYESLPLAEGGAVIEEELPSGALLGRTDRVSGGETADLAVTLEPGNYVLLCNLGGGANSHAGRGQTLDITVS